ncbi:hypothetical protein [Nocardiopsis synnemataformans]|uniref:hypothetical protein n=1 Tax=Nocardiopsis synnemataformans TaxID=61305 RepID=UPI003EB8AED9
MTALVRLPDLPEYAGRPVTWSPWRTTRVFCLPPRQCEACGSTTEAASSTGTLHPQQDGDPPPHLALIAFGCPDCAHTLVLDRARDYARVDLHQTTLF